jgi:hypothetical protein
VLFSLALFFRGRLTPALLNILLSFLFHPLMALAGAGFLLIVLALQKPRQAIIITGMLLLSVLTLGYNEFSIIQRLFVAMDSEWLDLTIIRSPFISLSSWEISDWNRTLLAEGLLFSAAIISKGPMRILFSGAAILGILGLIFTWVGGSLTHSLLLIQIQPWRVFWLTQLVSWIAAAWLLGNCSSNESSCRFLLLGFAAAWLLRDVSGGWLAALTTGLFLIRHHYSRPFTIAPAISFMLYLVPLQAVSIWLLNILLEIQSTLSFSPSTNDSNQLLTAGIVVLTKAGREVAFFVFIWIWTFSMHPAKSHRLISFGIAEIVFLVSVALWDRRTEMQLHFESHALSDPIPQFTTLVPASSTVYWQDDPTMSWFTIKRANYASRVQTAGLMFQRDTAIEGKRRMDRLAVLGVKDGIFTWKPRGHAKSRNHVTLRGLEYLCQDPELDYVVLSNDLGRGVIADYTANMKKEKFFLYDCNYLRIPILRSN